MTAPPERGDAVLRVFAVLWAVAALFHVLGPSARATGIVDDLTAVGVGHVLLAVAALAVIAAPGRTGPLVALAVLGPVTAWQESPLLGNHWLVVALVDVGLLLSLLTSRWDRARLASDFLPVARWVLICFYAFAAFAKLNHGFMDTTVSCANVYFDETARTLGFSTPLAVGHGGWASLVPVGTAAIELSVPVLLCIRRTRVLGVLVALAFHSAIAIDQEHLFSDFSSVLVALFTLFLPASFAVSVLDLVRRRGRLAVAAWAGLAAVASVAQWSGRGGLIGDLFIDGRLWLWTTVDVALLGAVGWWWSTSHRARAGEVGGPPQVFALSRRGRWLAVVPLVALLNGIAPYVELKTDFSYTMYANLITADGQTNHLLLPATLPIGDRLHDLVRVVSSNDGGLRQYGRYLLPWDSLRTYLAKHPSASITYERAGERHVLAHASDDPALVDAPPLVVQKLAPLRSVAIADPPPCQEVFLPAL